MSAEDKLKSFYEVMHLLMLLLTSNDAVNKHSYKQQIVSILYQL